MEFLLNLPQRKKNLKYQKESQVYGTRQLLICANANLLSENLKRKT
jgi:hypothetical protein